MSHMLELPDSVYQALLAAAQASGVSPANWIAERLPNPNGPVISARERRAALDRLLQCTVSLGHATGIENEQIDADLVREYAETHQVSGNPGVDS